MTPHSSIPAWKIPWTEEPGGLQSMGSRRVGHDWLFILECYFFLSISERIILEDYDIILVGPAWH